MASYFEPIYSKIISKNFLNDIDLLNEQYDIRYEIRMKYGYKPVETLSKEWDDDYAKLIKRRNWFWYLMKSGQYALLDEKLNTRIYEDKICYENRRECLRQEQIRIARTRRNQTWWEKCSKFKYWDFNTSEEEKQDDKWLIEYYNTPSTYKNKQRVGCVKPESEVYMYRTYANTEPPRTQEFINRIYCAAINLRNSILNFVSIRRNRPEEFELERLQYQGGRGAPEIKKGVDPIRNLIKRDNRPKCCNYCPTIVCMRCYKGEGCCTHERVRYQGNVKQDLGGDTTVVQSDKAHNVVLTETEVTQSDITAVPNPQWSSLVSSDVVSTMDSLVNRWLRVGTYTWNILQNRNATVKSLNLPRDAILVGANTCDQPNKIPFRIHRYWRGDMIVKIHINCNKFQIGQLQCSWYYQPKADNAFGSKTSVYTRSGTHHCVISAAPNNEVEMFIPFKAYKSMYHTKQSSDGRDLPLDLGTLFVTVLSPLKTTGETSPSCSFSVFVRFINNEFTGMIAGNIDTPPVKDELEYQMDGVGTLIKSAVPLVEKMLVGSSNDNNRDNPPLNAAPSYVVPTASHSWSIGTDIVEPLHNLRLSGRAQTNHPDRDVNEMSIHVLKRKYMLLDVFQWSQQNKTGNLLWDMPVNPVPPKDKIPKVNAAGKNTLASYQLTPIGFLSSLHQYWRGSIEFRFDIVASQFHSGKLLLAYIPGVAEGKLVTIEQARASPNVVISLDNAMSYTWRVPYVADRPWWPRRYAGESVSNNVTSPSKIFAFVLNELVMAETVPDSVEILVYMRGGKDMEFAIPVQPSIGLGYDRNYVASRNTSNVFPVSTTDTFYSGRWHSTPLVQVLRHASTSDAVGRFSEPILDRPVYYTLNENQPKTNIGKQELFPISTYIFLKGVGFSEYISLPVYSREGIQASIDKTETIARAAFENNYTYGDWVSNYLITAPDTITYNGFGFIPPNYDTTNNGYGGGKTIPFTAVSVSPSLESLEFQGNREEALAMIDVTQNLASTGSGMLTYGERFVDLKDLCRRYQLYGWTSVPRDQIERDPGACSFLFPVLPQGLNLAVNTANTVNQIWNRAREGHIPLIASLFRFYRGSIRMRIVCSNAEGLNIWIQHRPDRKLNRDNIVSCTQVSTAEAVFNHTYGLYIQAMSVNNVVEIEVPYYQMANYGLLQKPVIYEDAAEHDWSRFYSLGELCIGFFGENSTNTTTDVRCTIYYSMADDHKFSTYQGVPPMVLLDDLPEYQGNFIMDMFKNTPKEVGAQVAEGVTEQVTEQLQPMLNNFVSSFKDKIKDTYTCVSDSISELEISSKLTSIASQIIHAVNNPSATTIAISVISILITLGLITYSVYSVIHKYISEIWQWIVNKVTSKKVQEEVETAEEALAFQTEADNAVSGFLSLICGGLCTLFGLKNSVKYKPLSGCLFTEISNGMKMSNVCFVFFKNIMSVIGDMKAFIISHLYPGFNAAESLMESKDIIEKWVNYSLDIVDPINAQNIKYNTNLHMQLLDCYAFGKILKVKALETQYPAIIQLINTTFDKLHKLQVELVAQGIDPHVRKMPFVIYNSGPPEIGKSHLTTNICTELCNDQNIKTETHLMCVLNATSKFWDNCDRQPCLVMDDAFNIRKGPMLEEQIAAIFNVISPVVLVPPRAAVEDKGRTYNPEIFVLNSNSAFFKTEICLEQALWRRRDILIASELDTEFKKEGCLHCEKNLKVDGRLPKEAIVSLQDFHHLKFRYTFDVTNPDCVYQPENSFLKYPELIALLKDLFRKNREAENYKFADRIKRCNDIMSTRPSIVSNVENLEKLWNDAITKRKMAVDLVKKSTLTSISRDFAEKVAEKWEDCKHSTFKRIYQAVSPGRNVYDLLNPTCNECVRIKYQCVSCRAKLRLAISGEDNEPVPSTSSGSSIEELFSDPKLGYQGNEPIIEEPEECGDVSIRPFSHDVKFFLSDKGQEWFSDLTKYYDNRVLSSFKAFLDDNYSIIAVKLRKYPRYACSPALFKEVCVSCCICLHNISINPPIISKGHYCFINPATPATPEVIDALVCTTSCWLCLPWIHHKTVLACKKLGTFIETWMCEMDDKPLIFEKRSFDNVFAGMLQYVYDFYYKIMKPAAKAVFTFFTTIQGWIFGLSFLSLLFSTVIMGIGTYEVCKETAKSSSYVKSQQSVNHQVNKSIQGSEKICHSIRYETSSYESGKPKVVKASRPRIRTPSRATKDLKYQSAQQFDVVRTRLKNNMSSIDVVYTDVEGNQKRVRNYGIMLRDQQMLIQKHYYDYWRRLDLTTKFYFYNSTLPKNYEDGLLLNNFLDLEIDWFASPELDYTDSNFGILHLPKIVPAFKDITKFIAKSAEHEYIKFDECYLYSSLKNDSMPCVMTVEREKEVSDENGWLRLSECYSYRYTSVGLCGSALLCANLERPIIGIHFAGTSCFGYAEPICYESFNETTVKNYDYDLCDLRLDGNSDKISFDTLLYPQGTVCDAYSHHQGSISQYVPSLIHGAYVVDTEPNPLARNDERLPPGNPPLQRGVEHMGKPPLEFEKSLIDPAAEDLKDMVLANVKPIRIAVGKLSLQDAICGNVNVKGFEPLEWNSSEGFPLKSLRPKGVSGKRWLFDLEDTPDGYVLKGMHGELKRQLVITDNLRRQGIRCPTLFTDCLKDTCIDIEKCKIPGKTRIFSISPVQYTIAFKQYFGDFMASYQNARLTAEHGIGLNVDSMEWSQVANYITKFGDTIVAGDYKNFGPSLMLSCVQKVFDIIIAWYELYDNDADRQLVRRVLLSEILHAKHLCLNVVYGVPCGIPSGSPITTPLNSLVNSLYLRCGWRSITGESFTTMRENIKILTYGDDVCINVSNAFKEIYNTESLFLFFKKYNIVFTDIDKKDEIIKFRDLKTVTFLKRNFRFHPSNSAVFLAPIDEQSIRKCVNWIPRKGDAVANTLENCSQACELAFGHGPKYYTKTREFLQQECMKRLGQTFKAPRWYEKSEICYNI